MKIIFVNFKHCFFRKIVNRSTFFISTSTLIILIFCQLFIMCKRFKFCSFKYNLFERYRRLLIVWLKLNEQFINEFCDCDDSKLRRFFFECRTLIDVVYDVCDNCIWRHRDVDCSHNKYVVFVESTNLLNKRLESRKIIKSKSVEFANSTIYLSMRNVKTSMTTSLIISIFVVSFFVMIAQSITSSTFFVVAFFVVSTIINQNIENSFNFNENNFATLVDSIVWLQKSSTISFAYRLWLRNQKRRKNAQKELES